MKKIISYRQCNGFKTRIVDGEAFVISQDKIRHFNATATAMWLVLAKPTTENELVEILATIFPATLQQIEKDAKATLRLFESYNMIYRV